MDAIEQLVAKSAIRELAERYAIAVDRRDFEAVASLFVPDVDCGPFGKGREALSESFAVQMRDMGPTIMLVANHVIDLDGDDRARGVVYGVCEATRPEGWTRQAIQYEDKYRRVDGEWLFVGRRHELFYGVVLPYDPMAQPPANWPKSQLGKGTIPERWESWQRFADDDA